MLNDVHIPPVENPMANVRAQRKRQIVDSNDENTDRVRDRLPTATRSDVPEAIYGEPEDRGESFNMMMSAAVVVIVVVVAVGLVGAVFL